MNIFQSLILELTATFSSNFVFFYFSKIIRYLLDLIIGDALSNTISVLTKKK